MEVVSGRRILGGSREKKNPNVPIVTPKKTLAPEGEHFLKKKETLTLEWSGKNSIRHILNAKYVKSLTMRAHCEIWRVTLSKGGQNVSNK